jgi:hypothetical protein
MDTSRDSSENLILAIQIKTFGDIYNIMESAIDTCTVTQHQGIPTY